MLKQHLRIDWLREMHIESDFERLRSVALLPPTRYRDQSQIASPRACAEPPGDFVSRHAGEANVEQYDRRSKPLGELQRSGSLVCDAGLIPGERE